MTTGVQHCIYYSLHMYILCSVLFNNVALSKDCYLMTTINKWLPFKVERINFQNPLVSLQENYNSHSIFTGWETSCLRRGRLVVIFIFSLYLHSICPLTLCSSVFILWMFWLIHINDLIEIFLIEVLRQHTSKNLDMKRVQCWINIPRHIQYSYDECGQWNYNFDI